jgi:hypothetical protein
MAHSAIQVMAKAMMNPALRAMRLLRRTLRLRRRWCSGPKAGWLAPSGI